MASRTEKIRLDFNVLLYKEDSWWIAHCLEMDLPAEGTTPQEAIKNFLDIANVQIKAALSEGDLQSIFSPAPPELWKAFAVADDRAFPRKSGRLIKPLNRPRLREMARC